MFDWINQAYPGMVAPAAVFLAALIATLWLRRLAFDSLGRWATRTRWHGDELLLEATRWASVLWCLIISAYLALMLSEVETGWKDPIGKGLWTLLTASVFLAAINVTGKFIPFYGERWKLPAQAVSIGSKTVRGVLIVIAALVLLDIWGAPVTVLLLVIGVAVVAALLSLRGTLPNMLAGLQVASAGHVKVGDYVKLETGEEGYVEEIGWRSTTMTALDHSRVIVPNTRIAHSTLINYGRPLKKANAPFHFYGRLHLKELTGLKAANLTELLPILKTAPDSVVYYHTHHFLEEHHYLTPEPANDFGLWVTDALGDQILGERLAAIDTFEFPTLGALRERLASIIEEHLTEQHAGDERRRASDGREFYFIKSVSVVVPTRYEAHDLREFIEVLRRISLGSLYFHVFESRLRLGRGRNDFSVWLEQSLEEKDIADQIARLDPYNYTLEGLRSSLIQLIEKRIK